MKNRPGSSLLELAIYIALLTLIIGLAGAPWSYARDVLAVRAARDAIVSAAARARSHAVGHGGAQLRIDAAGGTLRVTTQDSAVNEITDIGTILRVSLRLDNTQATSAALPFDAMGIGRIANRTISIRRGAVTGGVTFSAYGRPRPW